MDDVLRGQPVLRCGRKCANKSRPEPGLASIGHGGMRWHGTCLNGKASRTTSCRSLGNNVEHKDSNLPVMNLRLVNKGIATRSKNTTRGSWHRDERSQNGIHGNPFSHDRLPSLPPLRRVLVGPSAASAKALEQLQTESVLAKALGCSGRVSSRPRGFCVVQSRVHWASGEKCLTLVLVMFRLLDIPYDIPSKKHQETLQERQILCSKPGRDFVSVCLLHVGLSRGTATRQSQRYHLVTGGADAPGAPGHGVRTEQASYKCS